MNNYTFDKTNRRNPKGREEYFFTLLKDISKDYFVVDWTDLEFAPLNFEYRILFHKNVDILDNDTELLDALGGERFDLYVNISIIKPFFCLFSGRTLHEPQDDIYIFEPSSAVNANSIMNRIRAVLTTLGYKEARPLGFSTKNSNAINLPNFDLYFNEYPIPHHESVTHHPYGKPNIDISHLSKEEIRSITADLYHTPSKISKPILTDPFLKLSIQSDFQSTNALQHIIQDQMGLECLALKRENTKGKKYVIDSGIQQVRKVGTSMWKMEFYILLFQSCLKPCLTFVRQMKIYIDSADTCDTELIGVIPDKKCEAKISNLIEILNQTFEVASFVRCLIPMPSGKTPFETYFSKNFTPSFNPQVVSDLPNQFGNVNVSSKKI